MRLLPPALLSTFTGLLIAAAPAAQAVTGSGRVATETRAVGEFDAIAQAGSIDLVVRQGGKEAVQVQAEDNLLPLVETVVESGPAGPTLMVRLRKGENVSHGKPIHVTVDVVRLSSLASSGSGDITVEALKTPSLKLSLSGSSDTRLQALATDSLEVQIAGSGDVAAVGSAKRVTLNIAGSGDARLSELVADDVSVRIAGSGDADVTANLSLEASVAGSGDVRYRGNVSTVRSSVAGSGSITRH
jgi:hypothetical protein